MNNKMSFIVISRISAHVFVGSFVYNLFNDPSVSTVCKFGLLSSSMFVTLGIFGSFTIRLLEYLDDRHGNHIWNWFPLLLSLLLMYHFLFGYTSSYIIYKILRAAFLFH